MNELPTDFQSLPEEYQRVILLAQDQHQISVTPLQLLVGGWSGAVVYLVSVAWNETGRVEHCILKLDRKGKSAKSDEVTRHNAVIEKSPPKFAGPHIPELVFDRVEHEVTIAIFYRIAGQSLLKYRPLSSYGQQSQLKTIFTHTNDILLKEWNVNASFQQAVHPQKILAKWLGFRLDEGGNIERFLQETCRVHPAIEGLLINGHVFPNPLLYARKVEPWGRVRSMDVATGFIHGDLNTNNILVRFGDDKTALEGYYLIDFALFKEGMPLLFDQRYLEMSYLLHALSQIPFGTSVNFVTLLAVADVPDPHKVPIEMSGTGAVIASARGAFAAWVQENHPSLHDDLWGQYWLAGVAAGLAYCHKTGLPKEARLAGLIYACANLRRYATTFKLSLPTRVELLYDEEQSRADTPGASTTKKSHQNLPAQPTPFIGRATQIKVLKDLILNPDVRLVTLLGPGGTGKTRLSLQVAQEALDHFPQGVFFVALADDTDANQFVSRVAQQLEVREGGRPLLENVKDYLRDKQLLLMLDNFEQLVSTAPIVAEMLAAAPQLKILTTSRIAVQLQGEREFPVPPLNLPKPGDISVEDLAGNESVSLFVERARGSTPSFTLTRENAPAVAEICRRLDGLPLALELAAARVKLLPPQAILTRLDDRFKLLTSGARDLPTRHQALRNTLEWSYSLLNEQEKLLYAHLSVFVGGFSLEAAEAVCNTEGKLDILEGLTSLVNNSLLRQEEIDGEPRFSMLETIRAYALERLAESGETESLRERHAMYFGKIVVDQTWPQLTSANALYWLNWLEREYDNIRATLTWCLSTPGDIDLGAQIVYALEWFWYRRGYFIEGRVWCERILASPSLKVASLERAWALVSSASMALWLGKPELGLAEAQEALSLGHRHEDEEIISTLNFGIAVMFINMGLDRQAQPLLAQARAYFKEQNQSYVHAATSIHLGNIELGLGNLDRARAFQEESLAEARAIGENWILSFALNNLGEVARTQGQYDLARSYYEECEALLRDTGDTGDLARFVHSLGYIAQHEGDYARAESQFRKSLTMFRQLGNRRGMAECMAGLAGLKARQGIAEWGAIMLSAAESVLKATGGEWWPADRIEVEANQEIIRSALSELELIAAQKKGKAMTLEQALAFASEGQTLS
jgi:predicted ATPase